MTINTPEEKTLSDRRSGARMVRKAIQKKIDELKTDFYLPDEVGDGVEALRKVEEFIDTMIARDKKRKGGLWN